MFFGRAAIFLDAVAVFLGHVVIFMDGLRCFWTVWQEFSSKPHKKGKFSRLILIFGKLELLKGLATGFLYVVV